MPIARQSSITIFLRHPVDVLDLQPISRELLDNVARPLRLMTTIELIKYSFVPTTNMADVQVKNSCGK